MKISAKKLAGMIDHTFLKPTGEADAICRLCSEAKEYGFASVCVNPAEVALAAKLLRGSNVAVCTVIGFPLGQNTTVVKATEADTAIRDGARELDFVINQRLLKAAAVGDERAFAALNQELESCVAVKRDGAVANLGHPKIVTKLILECCNLTDVEKKLGCILAKQVGFDFVKTSTGFGTGGATLADVKLMREMVGTRMGVKAAGGIRTCDDALDMLAAGATRLGCSAGVEIIREFTKG